MNSRVIACRKYFTIAILILLMGVLAGCADPYAARPFSSIKIFKQRSTSALDSNKPSEQTVQKLRLLFLDKQYKKDPQETILELEKRLRQKDDPELTIATAELCLLRARKYYPRERQAAVAMYLSAAGHAWDYLFFSPDAGKYHALKPSYRFMAEIYNRSVSRLVEIMQKKPTPWENVSRKMLDVTYELNINHGGGGTWDPDLFNIIMSANQVKVKILKNQYFSKGLGAPLVGFVEDPQSKPEFGKYNPPGGIAYPLTAMLACSPLEEASDAFKRKITLTFYDTLIDEEVTIENRNVPLEADYSTPLGILISKIHNPKIGFGGMLHPGRYMGRTGISMLEPYREDKIPVLMVHGLLSSPETWIQMFNDLRGDPEIREKYQFWFFIYPTGLPVMYSASLLRQELLEMQATFDPDGTHPAFEEMVVICHSLGGLISRLMVQDSGTTYYDSVFKVPFDELTIAAEEKETIRNIVFFDSMPSIKRVVFIATPHRGSPLADSFIGRLGSGFVSLPSDVTELGDAISANKEQHAFDAGIYAKRMPNSIDLLSPSSLFIKTLQTVPLDQEVIYHSIIGTRKSKIAEGSSDGIVPYESSHIDFAVSEKLVPSSHPAHTHPLAIDEVKRILLLHLKQRKYK